MFYIFLADGFEEIEALCPYDLLLRAGINAKTVSVTDSIEVTGVHGIRIAADMTVSSPDFMPQNAVGIMLPGGMPGAENLSKATQVLSAVENAVSRDALVCAICAAPFILGDMGLLRGKTATCFPGFENHLTGANLSDKKVVTCDNIITAKGMGTAFDFGIEIVKYLKGEKFASDLKAKTMA